MKKQFVKLDSWIIATSKRLHVPIARFALFVIFFYFGFLKILGLSPASSLAESLTVNTIGLQYFDTAFLILAFVECVIGILFLVPGYTRLVMSLLVVHMAIVCSPLILIPEYTWTSFLVPSLEGQYIIKNLALVALAIGIASHQIPLKKVKTAQTTVRA